MLLFLILLSSILPLQLKSFFHAEVAEPEVKPPRLQPPKCKAFSVKWQSVLLLQSGTAEREKSYLYGFIKYHNPTMETPFSCHYLQKMLAVCCCSTLRHSKPPKKLFPHLLKFISHSVGFEALKPKM